MSFRCKPAPSGGTTAAAHGLSNPSSSCSCIESALDRGAHHGAPLAQKATKLYTETYAATRVRRLVRYHVGAEDTHGVSRNSDVRPHPSPTVPTRPSFAYSACCSASHSRTVSDRRLLPCCDRYCHHCTPVCRHYHGRILPAT